MARNPRYSGMAHDGFGDIQGGFTMSARPITEGISKKGGLNTGPSQIQTRPAPPPPFRPATSGGNQPQGTNQSPPKPRGD